MRWVRCTGLDIGPRSTTLEHERYDRAGIAHETAANGHHERQEDDENAEGLDEDGELLISTQR